jgi:hypothetical protein
MGGRMQRGAILRDGFVQYIIWFGHVMEYVTTSVSSLFWPHVLMSYLQ